MRLSVAILLCSAMGLSASAHAENWPGFRGPSRQGLSTDTSLPVRWSATENVTWKVPVPGLGWSSPIVWGNSIFVTTADDEGQSFRILAFSAENGSPLWSTEVGRQTPGRKEDQNSYATPTPVCDGKQVYAVFADGLIAAVDAETGTIAWRNHDTRFYSKHGLGASPILYEDLLIMPFDGSSSGEEREIGWKKPWDQAFLTAIDTATGKERWRGRRGMSRIAHVTPSLMKVGDNWQLISGAGDCIQGFDPANGERLWSVFSQGEGVTPSIVLGDDGLVFTCSGFEAPTIRTVRVKGGDSAEIAWEQTRNVPSLSSLIHVDGLVYAVTDKGVASCLDAATGEVVWQERLGGNHSASPVHADGHLYFLSEQGETTVIKAGKTFEIVSRNRIEEVCKASLAISNGRIYLRSQNHLFAIGK